MRRKKKITLILLTLILLSSFNPFFINKNSNFNLFKVKYFDLNNYSHESNEEILLSLETFKNQNLFFLKEEEVISKLKRYKSIGNFRLKKKYPNTLFLELYSDKLIAKIKINKEDYYLTDGNDLIIQSYFNEKFSLPMIFGIDAEKSFIKFYKDLIKENFPIDKVISFYYFQINRWDLELNSGKIIKFPESNIDYAIRHSLKILDSDEFKNFKVLDLRILDQVIVK